ncbi:MAG: alpha/beta hydrolase [Acidimicrobiales bacterium]|nr:alpha/beta hydrolase [Acidimicrobiales bacterium]MCB9392928.1 alpha/beta hydrolase [Acidimicrobiaceae bacterium]
MSAVLLHGNPETPVIWGPLIERLSRTDVVTPQLPGFGCPVPAGFGATKEEYVDWFVGVVEGIVADSGPVDLVGHDWGGGIGMRAVALRPELFRSWVCDVLGLFHPDYVWHDFAQIWQTPGAGEEYFAQSAATPVEDRVAILGSLGIPADVAARLVDAGDELMGQCVLSLYRSAAQPAMAAWGAELAPAATVPGLAVIAPLDPFVQGETLGTAVADQLGARRQVLDGQGHWWMLGDPAAGAVVLEAFWGSI